MKKYFALTILCILTLTACNQPTAEESAYPNEVIETIMTRRSVRQYNDEPISHEVMDKILECGIHAPNGMNAQRWEVRVVESKKWIDDVTAAYKNSPTEDSPMAEQFKDPNFKNIFRNATSVIFISHRPGPCTQIDCGLMAGNMVNAAKSLGVSSVIMMSPISFFSTEEGKPFLETLALSEGQELLLCIGMGYSDQQPETPERRYSKVKYIQ